MALDRSIALLLGLPGVPPHDLAQLVARELERCVAPGHGSLPELGGKASRRPGHAGGTSADPSAAAGTPAQTANAILRLFRSSGRETGSLAVYVPGEARGSVPGIVDELRT